MRPVMWLPLALAVCVAGCSPPAPSTGTGPAAPGSTGSAATPAADPIVGKWQMSSEEAVVVFDFDADKKVTVDADRTRAGLRNVIEKRLDKEAAGNAQAKAAAMKKADELLDQQMKQFAEFSGTWEKAGELYKLQRTAGGPGGSDVSWAKVEGDQLIPTNDKGERKENEPVATRVPA